MRDQILAALRTEWPRPISTRRVCELLGANRYDETGYRVYPQLCALDRLGVVERIRRGADCPDVFWRFVGDPTDADLNAAVDAADSPRPALPVPPGTNDELAPDTEAILSMLDSYIKALDDAERRVASAAAAGDRGAKADAADALVALVRQFVDVCNNWPAASTITTSDSAK